MPPLFKKAGLLSDERGLFIEPLAALILKRYKIEALVEWTWEALYERLEADYGEIGPVTSDRIGAARILSAHNAAWQEWEVFEKVVAAAQGVVAIFSQAQPPDVEFAAIGLYVLSQFGSHDFHYNVDGYIAACCINDGLWFAPPPLNRIQPLLDEYHQKQGMDLSAKKAVAATLARRSDYIPEPETKSEFQFNLALGVIKAVQEYETKSQRQLKEFA